MPIRNELYMQNQRLRIIEAAFRCFSRQGLQKTSIRAISKEAGIAVGTIYIHFKDRIEILSSLNSLVYGQPLRDVKFKNWKEFRDHLTSTIDFKGNPITLEYVNCDLKLTAESQNSVEIQKLFKENNQEIYDFIKRCLSQFVSQKEIDLPLGVDTTARALRYLLCGMAYNQQFDGEKEKDDLVDVFNKTINAIIINSDSIVPEFQGLKTS